MTGTITPASTTATARVHRAFDRLAAAGHPEAWITLRERESALDDARRVDERSVHEQLPLAGQVFAVKDNIDVAGLPTTAASPSFAYVPERSAPVVERLEAAGAIVIGKTNLDQFATGLVGTRSPYGVVRNAVLPDRVSGGSSSGSAVAVSLGIVDFALCTDTAGSGRVPAAFHGLVGIKATLGLVPTVGVVPACPSYDCLTVMAPTLTAALDPMRVMVGPTGDDPHERRWPSDVRLAAPSSPIVGIPSDAQLSGLSDAAIAEFGVQVDRLRAAGAVIDTVDIAPMLDCARLLYDGALVAERYAAFGDAVEAGGDGIDPVVAEIIANARTVSGADVINDQQRVLTYHLAAERAMGRCDVLLLPTAPFHPTNAQVEADPIGVNSRLGTFTNFVNLLDMTAVAVPAGDVDGGMFGVSVIGRAFDDQVALDVAATLTGEVITRPLPQLGTPVVVFGAHMSGLPLNGVLQGLGARFLRPVRTAARFRMVALPGEIPRPGVVHADDGASLPGELWQFSPAALGAFLAGLPSPMTLGRIELDDGTEAVGFGCANPSGPDITGFGGWRAYLDANTTTSPQNSKESR